MDISYLLFLQDLRHSTHDLLTPFMQWVSAFAVGALALIPAFIYWCVDKKKGLFILASLCCGLALNAVVKLTACVYRPWIRDVRILPAGNAIASAGGYSFPSGHTTWVTAICGGIALRYRTHLPLVWLCVGMIVLTAFSRNYLGVHTPQDVLVGFGLTAACILGLARLFARLEAHPEEEDRWLLAGFLFGAAALVYISCKSYPMDYMDGKLLVDPKRMMADGIKEIGLLWGFCVARYVEKRWVRFRETGLNVRGVVLAALGFVPAILLRTQMSAPLKAVFGDYGGPMLSRFLLIFFVVALWPAVIARFTGKRETPKQPEKSQQTAITAMQEG